MRPHTCFEAAVSLRGHVHKAWLQSAPRGMISTVLDLQRKSWGRGKGRTLCFGRQQSVFKDNLAHIWLAVAATCNACAPHVHLKLEHLVLRAVQLKHNRAIGTTVAAADVKGPCVMEGQAEQHWCLQAESAHNPDWASNCRHCLLGYSRLSGSRPAQFAQARSAHLQAVPAHYASCCTEAVNKPCSCPSPCSGTARTLASSTCSHRPLLLCLSSYRCRLLTLPLSMILLSALSTACLAVGSRATGLPVAPLLPCCLPAHSCGRLGQNAPGARSQLLARPPSQVASHQDTSPCCCPGVKQTGPGRSSRMLWDSTPLLLSGSLDWGPGGLCRLPGGHALLLPACTRRGPGRSSRMQWGQTALLLSCLVQGPKTLHLGPAGNVCIWCQQDFQNDCSATHTCIQLISWAGSPRGDLRPSVRISGAAASGSDIRVAADSAVVVVAALQQH